MSTISRRKIATHAANKILDGKSTNDVLKELAAYLLDTGRKRESELIVREIEDALASRGVVIADVTSARPLTESVKDDIKKTVNAKKLYIRETIDPTILGGVRIDIPGARIDATIRQKLNALRAHNN